MSIRICQNLSQSVYLPVCLFVYLSLRLFDYKSICLSGAGIFPVNSRKRPVATCPCAFRLHRLAQNILLLGRSIFPVNSSHKVALVVLNLWVCGIFGINGDPAMFLSKRSLHDPVQVHNRLSCGDPGEILSERSLQLAWGARRCHVEYQDLVRSTPAATILWDSLKGPGMEILLKVFYNSLREGLVEIPSEMLPEAFAWSSTGPCEKLLKRSSCNPLGLLTWSGTGPCEKIVEILLKSSSKDP